jgi:hypothetical protein
LNPDQGYLPIMQPFIDIGNATGTLGLVKPVVDLLSPAFKVIIDLAYDRTANPGIPQTFQLIPIVNPVTLTVNLIVAGVQGIRDAVNDVGGTTPVPVSPFATTGPSTPVVNPNPNPNPNLITNVATRSLTSNNNQMTPRNGQLTNPFTIPNLPKSNGSSSTPSTGSNGWKPGTVIQDVGTAVKNVINDLTHPFTSRGAA